MAEDTDVAAEEEAPASPSSESPSDRLADLSLDELADILGPRIAQQVYRAAQSHTDSTVAALEKKILPFLEEGKQTTALVRALARGDVLSEEQMESMDRARAEEARVRGLEEDIARLAGEKAALEKAGLNDADLNAQESEAMGIDLLVLRAHQQGLITKNQGWDQLLAMGILPKERIASRGDRYGVLRYVREGSADIDKAADAKLHDEEPPTAVPGTRGAGATQQDMTAFELFKRGHAEKQATRAIPR